MAVKTWEPGDELLAVDLNDTIASRAPLLERLLQWAYTSAFQLISSTTSASGVVQTANIRWPDGGIGVFTTDTVNATFGAIDAWHATYVNEDVKYTITQPAVTRNATTGAVQSQPDIAIVVTP